MRTLKIVESVESVETVPCVVFTEAGLRVKRVELVLVMVRL